MSQGGSVSISNSNQTTLPSGGAGGGFLGGASPEPSAGVEEVLAQQSHRQVDGAAVGIAGEASERVPARGERQRGMMVVVEWAEAFVPDHPESESLGDPLDGEVAELLKFILFHRFFKF